MNIIRNIILLIILLGTVIALPVSAQTPDPLESSLATAQDFSHIDREIKAYMRRYQIPGGAVAVMQQGKVVYSQGYGWADKDNKVPAQANNLFRIASVSKTITGVAILQLIQQGKLHYDDKVFDILNDLQPYPNMKVNPRIYQLTVSDLLLMLTGWSNSHVLGYDATFGPLPPFWSKKYDLEGPLSCYDASRLMMGMSMQTRPGTHFDYVNVSYCYLGLIISKVNNLPYTPKAYEDYVKQNVLAPLGITDMRLGYSNKTLPNEVHYYAQGVSYGLPYGDTGVLQKTYPAGGWIGSPIDLVKFANGISQLLNQEQLAFLTTPPDSIAYPSIKQGHKPGFFYSSGWWMYPSNNGLLWIAHGSFAGTRAIIVKRPDGTIISAIFNTLPIPTQSALARLHLMLENVEC